MTTDRHTPYKAQLDRFLAEDPKEPFSARSLAEGFEHGRRDEVSRLRGIQNELQQAFADGRLVQYRDADGEPMTEAPAKHISSKRFRKPALYGLPDTPLPAAGAEAITYMETLRGNEYGTSSGHSDEPAEDKTANAEKPVEVDEDEDHAGLTDEGEALSRLKAYPPKGDTAPNWVDGRILRVWVSLPEVSKHLLHGLDTAKGPSKFELIRAGVSRKQRSGWRSESTIATNLAALCRKSEILWSNVVARALANYMVSETGVPVDEMPALAADPLDYYDNSEHDPDAVLLCAMAVGVEESALEMIAADCANLLGEQKVIDKATAQQERIKTLEDEAVELRRTAKEADKERRAAVKRERSLTEEIERLRAAQAEAGSAAEAERTRIEQELRDRAEHAETELEDLRAEAERIPELEAQVEGLENVRDRLDDAEAVVRNEQRLRAQAEQDAARHIARVRDLTEQLTRAADSRNLPIDDAAALVDALTRPIGHAARHATERMTSGRARPHDDLLLELAATVARMTGKLDSDIDLPDAETSVGEEPVTNVTEAAETVKAPVETPPGQPTEVPFPDERPMPVETEPQPTAPTAESETPSFTGRRRRSRIKVQPLGGAGEVGGSAILVMNSSGHTLLLDCGQRVRGEYGLDTSPQFHRRIGQDARLHAILLSHAHIDHVGSLPVLHREQSGTQDHPIPVYMTAPTRQLAQIMLTDSAKIQQHRETSRAEYGYLDYGTGTMEAAYRRADVNRVLDDEFVRVVEPARVVQIPDTSFVARFLPVAHVLGSCAIHLTDTENDQTLLYTGDLGPFNDPQITLPHYTMSELLAADLVVMESTYGVPPQEVNEGRRLRRSLSGRERAVKQMCDAAAKASEQGGCVLLPSFSLGRTQELAMVISQARADGDAPHGEILVAGMGEKITEVYSQYSKGSNAWARAENMPRVDQLGDRLRKDPDLSFEAVVGEVLDGGFSYIIASPAMLNSGWSRTFLSEMIDNPAHAVVMTGYIPKHAGGIPRLHMLKKGDLIDLGSHRPRIQAEFLRLQGLSAHAPSVDLRQFAKAMARQGNHVAFGMVHGEDAAQQALAQDVIEETPGVSAEALYNDQVWQPTRQ